MRRQLARAALAAVAVAFTVVMGPVTAAVLWVAAARPDIVTDWLDQRAAVRLGQLSAEVFASFALTLGLTALLTYRTTRRFSDAMAGLVTSAEQLGEGRSKVEPMRSGIPEVDRVSDVLVRSGQHVRASLAAERDFAADASHQLRTPLTALLMRLEEVAATDDLDVVHEEAGIAMGQVERLTRVVDDLLMRSRRANGGPLPEVSLDSVIASLQREWQPAFENARRSIRVDGERGLVVRAMPGALSQVLSTLLENSLVHGLGTVDVRARRSGPSVVVEVSDHGDGIAATIAAHIFQRSVSTGQGKSTGLGLALARDLAESNGGRLDLISARPAKFALFLSEAESR
ncbi:MAG TPA: HAMP domain-containing sensor histidine kinase [Candidatus Lustribacter sp.]|nr:HAMP domain-containing sensor histidine kinase [Candidatus Lustribacter sp.]